MVNTMKVPLLKTIGNIIDVWIVGEGLRRAKVKGNKGRDILIYSKDYDVTFYDTYAQFWQGMCKYKINFENLMQSTGLFDNNGVEIYEGDVVENFYTDEDGYSQKYTFAVVWEKGAFRRSDRLDETLEEELTSGFTNNHFILGNIHEQPELIGKEEVGV